MNKAIEMSLTERIKSLLEVAEGDLPGLTRLLCDFRNAHHPDRYSTSETKLQAEEKFKAANELLIKAQEQIEIEKLNQSSAALAVYSQMSELPLALLEIDSLQAKVEELNTQLESQASVNDDLVKKLELKEDNLLKQEIADLKAFYSTSSIKTTSIGLAGVLAGLLGIMSEMQSVTEGIGKFSPIGKEWLSFALFLSTVLLISTALRQLWETSYFNNKSLQVCSPRSAQNFFIFIASDSGKVPIVEFSEVQSYDFFMEDQCWSNVCLE